MITISQNPQIHSHKTVHFGIGQFEPGQVPVLSPDRRVVPVGPLPVTAGSGITFEEAAERFYREEVEPKRTPCGQDFVRCLLRSRLYPALAARPLDQITRAEIRELLLVTGTTRPNARKGSPTWGCEGRANSMFTFLHRFFVWCEDEEGGDLLDHNPCNGIHTPYPKRERERLLSPQEIRYFWQATTELGFPVGPIAQLLLLTGQRRGEIAGAYGGQVDRTQRMLTIPIANTKPKRNHLVPLSTLALEILDALPHGDPRDPLFPNRNNQPLNRGWFHPANKRIHARMIELAREELARDGGDPDNAYIEWFTYHDLRRTAATTLCERGHAVEVVDKIMNHSNGKTGIGRTVNSVTRLYCRYEALPERRAALQDLGQYVRELVAAPSHGVT